MKTRLSNLPCPARRSRGSLLVGCGALAGMLGAQVVVPEWALPPSYGDENPDHLVVTGGAVSVSGDLARFQERTGWPNGGFGGIGEMTIFRELGEDADQVLKVKMRAIAGTDEADLHVSYVKPEAWALRFSLAQHRRYFASEDGRAFGSDTTAGLRGDPLELDFGTIRFEATRMFEELPTVRIWYSRRFRDGERDSTVWGQVGARRVGASSRLVQESSDVFGLEISNRSENRRWLISGTYAHSNNSSTLQTVNDPIVNPAEAATQTEETETETVAASGYVVQKLFEGATLSLGGTVSQLDGNVSGFRQVPNGSAFVNLSGNSELYEYAVNGNLAYRWNKYVDSVVGLNVRGEELTAATSKNRGEAANVVTTIDERDFVDVAFETRLRNLAKRASLYFLVKRTSGDGVLDESGDRISRVTDSSESATKYALGVRLYPAPRTSLSGEIFRRSRSVDFVNTRSDTRPSLYPGHLQALEEEVNDANLRLTVRPVSSLHLVSRVDLRHRAMRPNFGATGGRSETDVDHLTFSQNVSFVPMSGWTVQAMASWTENLHRNPYSGTDSALSRVIPESMNDHWSLQLGLYGALNDMTDLQVDYTYFRANNFVDNRDVGVPFGSAEEAHRLNVIVSRQFSERVHGLLRYGYFRGRDLAQIDFNYYEAHVLYGSLHFRF